MQALYEERYLCPALKLGSCNSLSGPLPRPSNALKHHTHLWSYYFTTAELFHHPLGAPSILLAHETRMRAGTLSHCCDRGRLSIYIYAHYCATTSSNVVHRSHHALYKADRWLFYRLWVKPSKKDALSMTTGCLSDIRAIRPSVHFTARLFYDDRRRRRSQTSCNTQIVHKASRSLQPSLHINSLHIKTRPHSCYGSWGFDAEVRISSSKSNTCRRLLFSAHKFFLAEFASPSSCETCYWSLVPALFESVQSSSNQFFQEEFVSTFFYHWLSWPPISRRCRSSATSRWG